VLITNVPRLLFAAVARSGEGIIPETLLLLLVLLLLIVLYYFSEL
jgi:hypothetical protein